MPFQTTNTNTNNTSNNSRPKRKATQEVEESKKRTKTTANHTKSHQQQAPLTTSSQMSSTTDNLPQPKASSLFRSLPKPPSSATSPQPSSTTRVLKRKLEDSMVSGSSRKRPFNRKGLFESPILKKVWSQTKAKVADMPWKSKMRSSKISTTEVVDMARSQNSNAMGNGNKKNKVVNKAGASPEKLKECPLAKIAATATVTATATKNHRSNRTKESMAPYNNSNEGQDREVIYLKKVMRRVLRTKYFSYRSIPDIEPSYVVTKNKIAYIKKNIPKLNDQKLGELLTHIRLLEGELVKTKDNRSYICDFSRLSPKTICTMGRFFVEEDIRKTWF